MPDIYRLSKSRARKSLNTSVDLQNVITTSSTKVNKVLPEL